MHLASRLQKILGGVEGELGTDTPIYAAATSFVILVSNYWTVSSALALFK